MWEKYENKLNDKLKLKLSQKEAKLLLKTHKEKVKILQHERLIHLLVTVTVAISTLMLYLSTIFLKDTKLLLPDALLTILLVSYLIYYRKLEITVQRWYGYTDKLRGKE